MSAVKDKTWFSREGLFAKYVVSLVGLVVFVLAVNGAMETWISYRGTRVALVDAMGEKADATARRIEQSIFELERQISWVTRASATKLLDRRTDYAQLLNQLPAVSQRGASIQSNWNAAPASAPTHTIARTGITRSGSARTMSAV